MSLEELNNRIKELEKENNELKNKIKELEEENDVNKLKELVEDYKYKYYNNSLCGMNYIKSILDFDKIKDDDDFKDVIKNKILKTKNKIYKEYHISIKILIDIFLCKFCSYEIIDLLHNDDDINKFIERYYDTLLDISANNYMSCEGAEPFDDENDRNKIIDYLINYFNITSKDIDDVVLKEYITYIIKNYILSKIKSHYYKNELFDEIKLLNCYNSVRIKYTNLKDELLNNIINYLNEHNINIKDFNINYLENEEIKKFVDNYLNEVKNF